MMSALWLVPYGDNWGGVVERNGCICANNLHKQSPSLTTAFAWTLSDLFWTILSSVSAGLKFLFPPVQFLNCVHSCFGFWFSPSIWRSRSFLILAWASWDFLLVIALVSIELMSSTSGSAPSKTIFPLISALSPFQNVRTTCRSFTSLNFRASPSSSLT